MHQIAKINHCETSILGGNGIAVKLANAVATGIERSGLSHECQGSGYLPCKRASRSSLVNPAALDDIEMRAWFFICQSS
jgi:hypothetical protein